MVLNSEQLNWESSDLNTQPLLHISKEPLLKPKTLSYFGNCTRMSFVIPNFLHESPTKLSRFLK